MKELTNFKKQIGFTLAQTLVGVAVGATVALGVAGVIASAIEGSAQQRAFNTAEEATQLISGLLGDSDYCSKHFLNKAIPSTLPSVIADSIKLMNIDSAGGLGTTPIIGTGEKFQSFLTVSSLKLEVQQSIGTNRYLGSLNAEFVANTKSANRYFRQIPVFISTDTSNNLQSCGKYSQPAHGTTQGVYSSDCQDFASKGWSSKMDCLQDGRWHLSYAHSDSGAVIFGAKSELINHIRNGASIKVSFPPGTYSFAAGAENCTSIVGEEVSGNIACMGNHRRGVATWPSPSMVTPPDQAAVYFSSGRVYVPGVGYLNAPINWHVQY